MTEPITLLLEACKEKQLLRFPTQLKQLDLPILDELGYVPTGKAGTELLGSERLTGAALHRLTHRCHIVEATGGNFHLRDAHRRSRRATSPS